ncbi:MAG: hypothetical protein FJ293_03090 [Planctomycetes bacterium]|nr:hypothetical protein [Planctomycetota bacterium]
MMAPRNGMGALATVAGSAALLAGCGTADGIPDRSTIGARWFPAIVDGSVEITQGGLPGTASRVSLDDDLDLENDFFGSYEIELVDGPLRLRLGHLPLRFEGSALLDQEIVFHGQTFAAGTDLDSEFELTTWHASVDGALIEADGVEVRVGGGFWTWEFDLELRDRTLGVNDSREFSRLLPAVTASSWAELGGGFAVRLDGAFASLDEGRRLVDFAGEFEYAFDDRVRAVAGWRWLRYWLNEDTNKGLFDVMGPTFGFTLRL